jgi:RNA polymerase-binding protein DksA
MAPRPTDAQVDSLRKQLLLRREQLRHEVAAAESALREVAPASDAGDPSSHSDAATRHAMATAMSAEQSRDIAEIALVEAALERLSTGRFGVCIECGRQIPLRRLKAEPAAARCAACQAVSEQRLHRLGS